MISNLKFVHLHVFGLRDSIHSQFLKFSVFFLRELRMKLELEDDFEDVLGSRAVLKKVRVISLSLSLICVKSKKNK